MCCDYFQEKREKEKSESVRHVIHGEKLRCNSSTSEFHVLLPKRFVYFDIIAYFILENIPLFRKRKRKKRKSAWKKFKYIVNVQKGLFFFLKRENWERKTNEFEFSCSEEKKGKKRKEKKRK